MSSTKTYYFYLFFFIGLFFRPAFLCAKTNTDSLIRQTTLNAKKLYDAGHYYESADALSEVIELKKTYQPKKLNSLAYSHSNIAIVYSNIRKNDEALSHIKRAEQILKGLDKNHKSLGVIYGVMAGLYTYISDFDKAVLYHQQAIYQINKQSNIDNIYLFGIYLNLFSLSIKLNDIEQMDKYYLLAKSICDDNNLNNYNFYNIVINGYLKTQNNQRVENLIKELNEFKTKLNLKTLDLIGINTIKGDYLFKIKHDTIGALKYFSRALELTVAEFKPDHSNTIRIINNLTRTHYDCGNYYLSLDFAQKSIDNLDIDYEKLEKEGKHLNGELTRKYELSVTPLEYYINSKYHLYLKTNDLNHLQDAYNKSIHLTQILDILRWQWDNQSAEYLVDDKDADNYKMGQVIANELYKITGNKKYLYEAFEFNERSKGFNLLSNLRTQSAIEFGGIPNELLIREADLRQKTSTYKELIFNEEQVKNPNKLKISNWHTSLFEVSEEYDNLIKYFENNYPDYYELKFNTDVISAKKVSRKLRKEDLILEYSLKDSMLFTYVITRQEQKIYSQKLDTSFRRECLDFYHLLTDQSFSDGARKTFVDYTKLGYKLYTILIEPIKENLEDKNVIVVPDEEIAYISFEALLTEEGPFGDMDYYHLPYLVKSNGFSNSYSSTIQFLKYKNNIKAPKNILAFAPSYSNISTQNKGYQLLRQNEFDKLIRIPGTKEEVHKIKEMLNADVYEDYYATETLFKKNAKDYKILHLAMHTILDDKKPLFSKLAFTQNVDSLNDGFLHTYEIYNMQINAELAVLSSCSSGYGNLQEGQGIQSLSRSFSYAGCPSILMTLWEVSDHSTVEVMERFYYYLGEGESKATALHLAKLDFINNADLLKSNPYFWSSFILVGDTSPVYLSQTIVRLINISILLIPIPIFILIFIRYKKKAQKKVK